MMTAAIVIAFVAFRFGWWFWIMIQRRYSFM